VLRIFAILCFLGLMNPANQANAQTKPLVISSFTIIEDWIHVIAPEGVEVENIVPSHSETHGFQISPRHARELRRASLIVGMSPTLEP